MAFFRARSKAAKREPNPDGECPGPVEIWQIYDFDNKKHPMFAPYFVASCGCGWVGTACDDSEIGAESTVRQEAAVHCANVAIEVTYPVGKPES